jgi:hypothetical protein
MGGGALFEKSLSLDDMDGEGDKMDRSSHRLLDDIFMNRESRFNASDLARLVDQSQAFENQRDSY